MSLDEAREAAHNIGYPVLVRPSYVLGGRGMEIVYDDAQLRKYVDRALKEAQADTVVSGRLPSPLLIDKFLQDAVEIDVDALFDGEELYIGGIMEHVEEAGVHSGDAACTLPPSTLSDDQIRRLREGTYAIAKGCGVQGLINVQYAFMANTLYVIEANPRASRTVPFASKATGVHWPRRRLASWPAKPFSSSATTTCCCLTAMVEIFAAVSRLPSRNPCFRSSVFRHTARQDRRRAARTGDAFHRRGHGL